MSEADESIDWSRTTFEGSRREQLRRWRALTLRQRLEALDRMSEHAGRAPEIFAPASAPSASTLRSAVREPSAGYPPDQSRHEHVLHGCTPTPLASYLKALAVLRLVAEQAGDPDATGCWRNDVFVLRTRLSHDELLRFFLERYEPTPLVAPWNGGSGFYPKDNREGVQQFNSTSHTRFSQYRDVIELCRSIVSAHSPLESPKAEHKHNFLQRMRGLAPDPLLRWMDAAVILSDEDPRYPPLLGTGGNDGRLDFTNNFMQRLGEVFDTSTGKSKTEAAPLLLASLLGYPSSSLRGSAIGQFSPGSAGGPNASSGFEGGSRVNPWDFILMLEGAVMLAASAVRRLESSSTASMSAPFTVRSRAATVGGASAGDDADARGEIWMPLWATPYTIEELTALFSEGRATLGSRPVQDGLDFARAVARLGLDRGITAFQRYAFLQRSGKAFLATPMGRVAVRRNPQADLIDELDRREWLTRVRRYSRDDRAPNSFRALAAELDAALFTLTQRADRQVVERVVRVLGRLEIAAARSNQVREHIAPVPTLSAAWTRRLEDNTAEFRIAAALAGLSLRGERDGRIVHLGLRPHLAPTAWGARGWDENSHLVCWKSGGLEHNLPQLLRRRRLEAAKMTATGEMLRSRAGATLLDVRAFLDRETNDGRIMELTQGLALIEAAEVEAHRSNAPIALPPAYALLKPFFTPESVLLRLGWLPPERSLHLPPEISARLEAEDPTRAVHLAWQRLRSLGVKLPGRQPPQLVGVSGQRLLAALMIPLTYGETRRLLLWLDLAPEH